MPKITIQDWAAHAGGVNPLFGRDAGPYAEIVLGEAAGLTQFGVRLERLPPGSRSSERHWHETEDEFVYVLEGELVLVEDVETVLRAGEAAGWPAGVALGHCLENRSGADAVMLVVGTRSAAGVVHYPGDDLAVRHGPEGRQVVRGDGEEVG
ncbi:cupin domain-containing protein [Ovoidimarina sediminis]|uniref:cupin domain-containing protein n=1 Tax=Ovoidimarina sediminis TaxID=3079856 RepID=UPI0029095FE2|nr:cupin domain-containing protein [Rhodophyticola sp. MJ-SS7]MDU8942464.1 cupin domain-containing protein [Rhodophyticola sp. MJ-SS7]